MDGSQFDAWTRRRFSLTAVGFAALIGVLALHDAEAKNKRKRRRRRRKKRCPDGRGRCGGACCSSAQGCVNGRCGCAETACDAATDPTDDEFEACSCDVAVGGAAFCMAVISCVNPAPQSCASNADCAAGSVCQAVGCGGQPTCVPGCSLV
ncbi:MAG: hypothetical protein ACRDJC_07585 [Thermomicrobiales bacterium]